jgi:hypothetical protein
MGTHEKMYFERVILHIALLLLTVSLAHPMGGCVTVTPRRDDPEQERIELERIRTENRRRDNKNAKWIVDGLIVKETRCECRRQRIQRRYSKMKMAECNSVRNYTLRVDGIYKGEPPKEISFFDSNPCYLCDSHPSVGETWKVYIQSNGFTDLPCGSTMRLLASTSPVQSHFKMLRLPVIAIWKNVESRFSKDCYQCRTLSHPIRWKYTFPDEISHDGPAFLPLRKFLHPVFKQVMDTTGP